MSNALFGLKSYEKGDGFAAFQIGEMYRNGMGVNKNRKTALEWYKKSVELQSFLSQ